MQELINSIEDLQINLNLIPRQELISCIEDLGYLKIDLKIDDIAVFFNKSTKKDNDHTNKLRESIILNKKIPKQWYSQSQWFKVALRLKDFLKHFNGELKEVKIKAGRKYNYDFDFIFENENVKIEFKWGVKSISKYPQILSIGSNTFVKGLTYAEYFYDFYLPALTTDELPTKDFYLKNIHKIYVNHPFFIHLKEVNDSKGTAGAEPPLRFKGTVDKSIEDYLQNYIDFDFDAFKEKIKYQLDKKYMLWDIIKH